MNRAEVLKMASCIVTGQRAEDYGTPEDNFRLIADLWSTYLGFNCITATDVANMMILLKIARIQSGKGTDDCFVDIAGYAACGAEINSEVNERA